MAVAEEETMEEKDKGTLTYQECKVFHAEPHLCSVYDNNKTRIVTFEVYGLDTQDMFHKQYTYADFDGLFRFNAELMNPNRKEGRYNWVIRRLEILQVGTDKKLLLSNEVTKEVPELPIYETTRDSLLSLGACSSHGRGFSDKATKSQQFTSLGQHF